MSFLTAIRDIFRSREKALHDDKAIKFVRSRNLTYLSDAKLLRLVESIQEIHAGRIGGSLVEAGCALGGSLVIIAAYSSGKQIDVYDTFEMIPPPTKDDPAEVHQRYSVIKQGESKGIGGDIYYGYRKDLLGFVKKQVSEFIGPEALDNITFHKGLLQDNMSLSGPIAFAHIDVDWYESVKCATERLWPILEPGGMLVFDDYNDWGGCKKAVDEYFKGASNCEFDSGANLIVRKSK
jgi:hypothetical protein